MPFGPAVATDVSTICVTQERRYGKPVELLTTTIARKYSARSAWHFALYLPLPAGGAIVGKYEDPARRYLASFTPQPPLARYIFADDEITHASDIIGRSEAPLGDVQGCF
jgi:hypothetical protein